MLEVECVTRRDALPGLREEWEDLLRRDPHRSIFQSFPLCLAWLESAHPEDELRTLIVREDGRPVGCAPMILKRSRLWGRCLCSLAPRCDFIIPERRGPAIRALVEHWERTAEEWDVILLRDMAAHASSPELLEAALGASPRLRPAVEEEASAEAVLSLAGTWEEYLSTRSRNFRKQLNREMHELESAGSACLRTFRAAAELELGLEILLELERRSEKAARGKLPSPPERACLLALARDPSGACRGEVRVLELDRRPIAAALWLEFAGRRYGFLTYYHPEFAELSPGGNLLALTVRDSFADPCPRGLSFVSSAPDLRRWATGECVYRSRRLYNARARSRALAAVERWRGEHRI